MASTFLELFDELKSAQERSPAHAALIAALENLEQRAQSLRSHRNRSKLPNVSARDRDALLELHRAVGNAADQLLSSNQENEELKNVVRKLSALSSRNCAALLEYDPARHPRTLAAIEEGVRTLTLHVGPDELRGNRLGANLSERIPLSFYDEKGNKNNGVFTKKKELHVVDSFFSKLDEAVAAAPPENQAVLKEVADYLRENVGSFSGVMTDNANIQQALIPGKPVDNIISILRAATHKSGDGKRRIAALELTAAIRPFLPGDLAKRVQPDMFFGVAEKLSTVRAELIMNRFSAKIPEGGRIDSRNSAVSTMADLLGMPNIVARSRPMKIVNANGVEQEGCFMELAKGYDVKNLPPQAAGINQRALQGTNGMGFRDLANLQILDYLCGNVDRHAANFTYQFDKKGKFCGVQGFDNDCAFGLLSMGNREGHNRMVGTADMRAIPRSTYERIMRLDPPMLKYALRGFGLSEQELNCAAERLNDLQTALTDDLVFYRNHDARNRGRKTLVPGHIRVLEDKDWRKYSMNEFCLDARGASVKNAFSLARNQIERLGRTRANQEAEYRNLSATIAVGISNRANPGTPAREFQKAANLRKLLEERTYRCFTSPAYRTMQEAVKNYTDYMKQIQARIKTAADEETRRKTNYQGERDAVVTTQELERMRQLSLRMKETAQAYLNGKLTDNGALPANASDYTKKRVDIARQVLEYGTQGERIRDEERLQAQANEAQAGEQTWNRNRIIASEFPKTPVIPQIGPGPLA